MAKDADREARDSAAAVALAYARRFPMPDNLLPAEEPPDPPLPPLPAPTAVACAPLDPDRYGDVLQVTHACYIHVHVMSVMCHVHGHAHAHGHTHAQGGVHVH